MAISTDRSEHRLDIRRTNETSREFLALVESLDQELAVRDGAEHGFYAQFNKPVGLGGVVVAFLGETPVGCGAFKKYDDDTAEIKRMFVSPEARGKGVGGAILAELEQWAQDLGYSRCVLETGLKQPEAISLYTREGYSIIPNYGQYAGVENSVCMEKLL